MANARIEVIADLLELCRQPKRKDWITERLNLNEVFSHSYLTICTSQKLLDINLDKTYVTTEKGQRFLKTYASFSDIVKRPILATH